MYIYIWIKQYTYIVDINVPFQIDLRKTSKSVLTCGLFFSYILGEEEEFYYYFFLIIFNFNKFRNKEKLERMMNNKVCIV